MTIRGFRQGSVAQLAAVVTAALIAAGTPAAWAGPAASAKPATALEVQSEPAGAAVYVDGQLKGATPVAVEGIVSGDHTVRVVKDGFLENSRVVSVPASGRSLHVALTPTRVQPRADDDAGRARRAGARAAAAAAARSGSSSALGAAVLAGGGFLVYKLRDRQRGADDLRRHGEPADRAAGRDRGLLLGYGERQGRRLAHLHLELR